MGNCNFTDERLMVRNYDDFLRILMDAGFSMGGTNAENIFAITPWSWNEQPPYDTPVRWHTGDAETDPWEWRMRVLEERDDIAYAKLFFKKSGFITRQWYPYFLAARRGNMSFDDAYESGTINHFAKRIYDVVVQGGAVPVHDIKQMAGFGKDDKSSFDRALTELQMRMYLTMCGSRQKSQREDGWASTVFCTTEEFFGEAVHEEAASISKEEAQEKIREQILKLNTDAQDKKISKFILG